MRRLSRLLGVRLSGGWPGWAATVVVFAIAVAGVASGPVYVEAVADTLADDALAAGSSVDASAQLVSDVESFCGGSGPGATADDDVLECGGFAVASAAIGSAIDAIPDLDLGPITYSVGGRRTIGSIDGEYIGAEVRLIARTGGIEILDVVAGGGVRGAWISEIAAGDLGAGPGEILTISDPEFSLQVPIAGVYRDFDAEDAGPYWSRLPAQLLPRYQQFYRVSEPQLVIVAEETFFALTTGLAPEGSSPGSSISLGVDDFAPLSGKVWWQTEPIGTSTGGGLLRLAADLRALQTAANDPTVSLGSLLFAAGMPRVLLESELIDLSDRVSKAEDQIAPAVASIQVTIALVALLVVALGGSFVARRRLTELRMWTIEGRAPGLIGWSSVVGAVVPAVLGTAAGIVLTPVAVATFGPSGVRHDEAIPRLVVALFLAAGLGLIWLTSTVAASRSLDLAERTRSRRWIWDIALYGVAITLFVQLLVREPVDAASGTIDVAVIIFPIVGVAALAALALWLMGLALSVLRRRGSGLPIVPFLAWRRVAAADGSLGIVFPIALAAGVALFASALVASLDGALEAKSLVAVGSEVSAPYPRTSLDVELPRGFSVVHTGSGVTQGRDPVRLVVLDPDSYREAITWKPVFGMPLEELLSLLDGGGGDRVSAVITGPGAQDEPVEGIRRTQKLTIAYEVVGHLDAIPLMSDGLATIVMSRDTVLDWAVANPAISGLALIDVDEATGEPNPDDLILGLIATLISSGDEPGMNEFLRSIQRPTNLVEVRADSLSTAAFAAPWWAFQYLRMLGFVALLLAMGVFAYFMAEARQRLVIAHALERRMGLSRVAAAGALGAEVFFLIGIAVAIGAAAAAVLSVTVMGEFDPLPRLLPGLRTLIPGSGLIVVGGLALAGGLIVWALSHRATGRSDVAEVLRVG